ncbi:MAG: DUF4747 family protein [Leptothrix ochracea]|uniref:DUF4747 family protein n=1 Tax=Leptothrix ochracea TaxID=735331 RepID=UPI0034E2CE32
MERTRTITVSCLNLAMHSPHSRKRYVELLSTAFSAKRMVRLGSVHGGMIGSLYGTASASAEKELTGELYRFLKLDPDEPWFNAQTKAAASPGDLEALSIPQHLLPHLQRIPFLFKPGTHRLYLISKDRKDSLSPSAAKQLLDGVFQPLTSEGLFPPVEITVEPAKDALDEILSLKSLEHLVIELVPPNPDDGDDIEKSWKERLKKQNVRKQTVQLDSERNQTIKPDAATVALAKVAASNGKVTASGHDAAGVKQDLSTIDKPLRERVLHDPNVETLFDALRRAVDILG